MKTFDKIIGVLNLLLLLTMAYLVFNVAFIAALFASTIGLLFLLILIVFPIIYGTVQAVRYLFSKKENRPSLTSFEKILKFAPLVNVLLFLGVILFVVTR